MTPAEYKIVSPLSLLLQRRASESLSEEAVSCEIQEKDTTMTEADEAAFLRMVNIWKLDLTCPECQQAGQTSKLFPQGSSATLLYCPPFYDESGQYHHHDSNRTTTHFHCSNGHEFSRAEPSIGCCAPGCTWKAG